VLDAWRRSSSRRFSAWLPAGPARRAPRLLRPKPDVAGDRHRPPHAGGMTGVRAPEPRSQDRAPDAVRNRAEPPNRRRQPHVSDQHRPAILSLSCPSRGTPTSLLVVGAAGPRSAWRPWPRENVLPGATSWELAYNAPPPREGGGPAARSPASFEQAVARRPALRVAVFRAWPRKVLDATTSRAASSGDLYGNELLRGTLIPRPRPPPHEARSWPRGLRALPDTLPRVRASFKEGPQPGAHSNRPGGRATARASFRGGRRPAPSSATRVGAPSRPCSLRLLPRVLQEGEVRPGGPGSGPRGGSTCGDRGHQRRSPRRRGRRPRSAADLYLGALNGFPVRLPPLPRADRRTSRPLADSLPASGLPGAGPTGGCRRWAAEAQVPAPAYPVAPGQTCAKPGEQSRARGGASPTTRRPPGSRPPLGAHPAGERGPGRPPPWSVQRL